MAISSNTWYWSVSTNKEIIVFFKCISIILGSDFDVYTFKNKYFKTYDDNCVMKIIELKKVLVTVETFIEK